MNVGYIDSKGRRLEKLQNLSPPCSEENRLHRRMCEVDIRIKLKKEMEELKLIQDG